MTWEEWVQIYPKQKVTTKNKSLRTISDLEDENKQLKEEISELKSLLMSAYTWFSEISKLKRGYTQLQTLKVKINEVLK